MSKLERTIKLPAAIALYITSVLGSGILIVPGIAAEIAGPASIVAWGVMSMLVIPLALVMGYLSQKYPDAGGVSHFVTIAFGKRLGAIVGWFFLMSVAIGGVIVSITGSSYVVSAFSLDQRFITILAILIIILSLLINYIGMKVAGKIQVLVISGIVAVIIVSIVGAVPNIDINNFEPFLPNGFFSIANATTILFWCFIGWEAVSHLSSEFVNPKRDTVLATIIAAIVVGILYFLVAFVTVGTKSYGDAEMASLVKIVFSILGQGGGSVIGITSYLICLATAISYIGAASRVAYSLSITNFAPKFMGKISSKYKTPIGGLKFLSVCFFIVLTVYSFKLISLSQLIKIPNSTFILTYLLGCAAGVVLFKNERGKFIISSISFSVTLIITFFIGWPLIYPVIIVVIFILINNKGGEYMGIGKYISNQFSNPSGIGGYISTFIMNRLNKALYKCVIDNIKTNKDDKVLDIGFGNGYLIRKIALNNEGRYYGIEISEDMIRQATTNNMDLINENRMTLINGNVMEIPFEKGLFNIAYTVNTVYFWPDLQKGLSEVKQVLGENGVFINAFYSKEWIEKMKFTKYGFTKYIPEELKKETEKCGFKDVKLVEIKKNKAYYIIARV